MRIVQTGQTRKHAFFRSLFRSLQLCSEHRCMGRRANTRGTSQCVRIMYVGIGLLVTEHLVITYVQEEYLLLVAQRKSVVVIFDAEQAPTKVAVRRGEGGEEPPSSRRNPVEAAGCSHYFQFLINAKVYQQKISLSQRSFFQYEAISAASLLCRRAVVLVLLNSQGCHRIASAICLSRKWYEPSRNPRRNHRGR
jgi:hypothetical protein